MSSAPLPFSGLPEVAVSDFKARCLALLEQVRTTGRPLLITKRGRPLAQILPPPKPPPHGSPYGCMVDTALEVADIVQPTDEDEWEAFL